MQSETRSSKKRIARSLFRTVGFLVAWLLVFPAAADHRRPPRGKGHVILDSRGRVHLHVPHRIDSRNRALYREYRAGRFYYRPHHHYHLTYAFPVWIDGVVVERPYHYCGSDLFLNASVHLPRLAVSIDLHPRRLYSEEIYGYYWSEAGEEFEDDHECDDDDHDHDHDYGEDDDDDD